jgi:uncharacterized protein YxeA
MKKILIMLGVVILVLVISGVIVVNKIKENPQKAYYQVWRTYQVITTLPIKIANVVAPPSIKNKSPQQARKIVTKLFKEYSKAGEKRQIMKAMSIYERILKMGNPVVPVLAEIISDEKEEKTLRKCALGMLKLIGEEKGRPLEELYEQEWARDLFRSSWELAQGIDIDEAVPAIIGLLQEKDVKIKVFTIETLGKIKDRRAVEPLIELLSDKRPSGQGAYSIADMAAKALREIGDERAIEPLVKAGYYGWEGDIREEYREKAIRLWKEALEKLPEDDKYKRRDLLQALGKAGDPEAVPTLLNWLERERKRL